MLENAMPADESAKRPPSRIVRRVQAITDGRQGAFGRNDATLTHHTGMRAADELGRFIIHRTEVLVFDDGIT